MRKAFTRPALPILAPVGELRIVAQDGAVTAIEFSPFLDAADGRPRGPRQDDDPLLREVVLLWAPCAKRDRHSTSAAARGAAAARRHELAEPGGRFRRRPPTPLAAIATAARPRR